MPLQCFGNSQAVAKQSCSNHKVSDKYVTSMNAEQHEDASDGETVVIFNDINWSIQLSHGSFESAGVLRLRHMEQGPS